MPPQPPFPGQPPKTEGMATTSLVLGILSLVCLGCLAGIPAVICGHMAKGRIEKSGGTLGGSGTATAGLIMGYISLALTLLVVPLLSAIAVPNFIRARQRSQNVLTKSTIQQITSALNMYQTEYGKYPIEDFRVDAEGSDIAVQKTLRGVDTENNPRKIVFLELSPKSIEKDRLVDVWGHPLHFWFDGNGDSTITVGEEEVHAPVAIWSNGPNGIDDHGGGDDVTSWKELSRTIP